MPATAGTGTFLWLSYQSHTGERDGKMKITISYQKRPDSKVEATLYVQDDEEYGTNRIFREKMEDNFDSLGEYIGIGEYDSPYLQIVGDVGKVREKGKKVIEKIKQNLNDWRIIEIPEKEIYYL